LPDYESDVPVVPTPKRAQKVKSKPRPIATDITASDAPVCAETVAEKYRWRPRAKLRNGPRQLNTAIIAEPTHVIAQPECNMEIKRIVEAILFAANGPMTAKQVQQVFPELEQPELQEIQAAIDGIVADYRFRPVELKKVASGYRFQVKKELSRWVSRLFEEKPPKYSRALLETLAIIAYRQPVTRGDIEDIRGVSVSSSIMQTLLERDWIRILGHKEAPGRPAIYGTTKQFLDYFNITSIDELPTLQEIQNLDLSIDNSQQAMQVTSEKQETSEQIAETNE
jgi:segregation and condensation protein B